VKTGQKDQRFPFSFLYFSQVIFSYSLSLSKKSHFLLYLLFYTITHYSNRLNVV
jgi:hypothetical protein